MRKFLSKRGPGVQRKQFVTGFLILVLVLMQSCGVTKESNRADISSMEDLEGVVSSMQFEVTHEYAQPLNSTQIDLIGNPNFIRFKGDTVDLFLPYFGVRHLGGDYGGRDGGIEYEGPVRNLEIEENADEIILHFDAQEKTEDLSFQITLYPNGRANTSVNSSQRQAISYRGWINKLPEQE